MTETTIAKDLVRVDAGQQIGEDYTAYAMAVNLGRAIPHVVDGLKPSQRRVLYAMHDLGLASDKPFRKCARIEGEVMGRLHPHGCLRFDTKVALMDGTRQAIGELAAAGRDRWVMSWDSVSGTFVPAIARHFRVGKTSTTEYRIWLYGYSEPIACTDNHEFLADGQWTRADCLKPQQNLFSGAMLDDCTFASGVYRENVYRSYPCFPKGSKLHVHHVNRVKSDNDLSNLMYLTASQHQRLHQKQDGDVYKAAFAKGRTSLFSEDGAFREATKAKNSALMGNYNSVQSVFKAHFVVQELLKRGLGLTPENYELVRAEKLVYNAPKLKTILAKGLTLAQLVERPVLDTSAAVGFTAVAKTRAQARKTEQGTKSAVPTALSHYVSGKCGQKRKSTVQSVLQIAKVDSEQQLWAKFPGRWFGKIEKIEQVEVEPTDYYDCTVEGTECFFIEVDGQLVLTHNSAYPTLVNMANDWANRYTLVDGQGNFGTTSDGPAASRYTEARLRPLAEQVMLQDLALASTLPTYDNNWVEPVVLPARLPMLLLRDTAGIGVAAACRHISYNIGEVAALCQAALAGPLQPSDSLKYISKPDFAMGGQIVLSDGMKAAIEHGQGSFKLRAKLVVEGGNRVVATELPQDISPETVLEQTYKLLKEGDKLSRRILTDARDESDRHGTRVVWELRKVEYVPAFIDLLWQYTSCQVNISVNAVSVDTSNVAYSCKGVAQVANEWAAMRRATETKRLQYELAQASARLSVVHGMLLALGKMRQVVEALLADQSLRTVLPELTDEQVHAIESMPLRSLRKLSQSKLETEASELGQVCAECNELLTDAAKLTNRLRADVRRIAKQFDDGWRSTVYAPLPEELTDKTKLTEAIKPKQLYLLDNRLEGKEHTYSRTSYRVAKLSPVVATETHGVAAIMSNGSLYWLPAAVMPIDSKSAESAKSMIARYTGKPWEPGTQVVWSELIDKDKLQSGELVLPLVSGKYGKLLDVKAALNEIQARRKSVWIGFADAELRPDLADKLQPCDVYKRGARL